MFMTCDPKRDIGIPEKPVPLYHTSVKTLKIN